MFFFFFFVINYIFKTRFKEHYLIALTEVSLDFFSPVTFSLFSRKCTIVGTNMNEMMFREVLNMQL